MRRADQHDSSHARLNEAVIADALRWLEDPELGRLARRLLAHERRGAFLDTYAEAAVGRQLLAAGYGLRLEVPTPAGKRCDFEVQSARGKVYVHVKRMETLRRGTHLLPVPARLRVLERIARPLVVEVLWRDGASSEELQRLVIAAEGFLARAHVGEEHVVRDEQKRRIGGVRVIGPGARGASHVQVTIGLPAGFFDATQRVRRLMERAYGQFMPRAENLIVLTGLERSDAGDADVALLGSPVERWDEFPERGRRVAHGRSDDGFWWGRKRERSRVAAWMWLSPSDDDTEGKVWVREGAEAGEQVRRVAQAIAGE